MASKQVMRKSFFADQTVVMPEPDVISPATMCLA